MGYVKQQMCTITSSMLYPPLARRRVPMLTLKSFVILVFSNKATWSSQKKRNAFLSCSSFPLITRWILTYLTNLWVLGSRVFQEIFHVGSTEGTQD